MNINKYIHSLIMQLRAPDEATDRNEIRDKLAYARAYMRGEKGLARYRDRAIAAKINKIHDTNAQLAILFNKDIHPDEYEAYQVFRAECKVAVDAKMQSLKEELEAILN